MNKKNKKIIQSTIIIGIIIGLIWVVSAEFGETHVEFSLVNAQHSCQFNAEGDVSYWTWWEESTNTIFRNEVGIPIPPKFSCYHLGGYPSDGCCPEGLNNQCNPPLASYHPNECYGLAPEVCSEYNAENYGSSAAAKLYCGAFNPLTAITSVEKFTGIVGICSGNYAIPVFDIPDKTNCNQYTSNCRCSWNETSGECESKFTSYTFCDDNWNSTGDCTQDKVKKQDDCIERGLITYNWTAIWNSDSVLVPKPVYCKDGTKTFSCNMIKLSFFSFMNVIVFVLIVVIIYCYKYRSNNKSVFFQKKMQAKNLDTKDKIKYQ